MKRIFPIITVLIFLSLMGLIFFQFLWIRQTMISKEEQLEQLITLVTFDVGEKLIEEKGKLSPFEKKRSRDALTPLDIFPASIANSFTADEIRVKIRKIFHDHGLKKLPFEFAIFPANLIGDDLTSEQYAELAKDTIENKQFVTALSAPSGSNTEGVAPEELLAIIVPHLKTVVWRQLIWMVAGAVLFTIIIFTAFFITVRALLKQKKLSEIKSDFINNMTHEFKTPLATISLAVDALKNEKVVNDRGKTDYFTGIIKEENKRMNKQVETILQAAMLDKQEIQLNLKLVHAHDLINAAVNNVRLPMEEKQGQLDIQLNAANDDMFVDEVHFTNVVNNLLDNAMKYSKDHPVIKLCTSNVSGYFKIKIEDNGIGMNKETLHRIFEKFYRAHTGNIHNVKGFGLGLSYVKTIIDAHKGKIKADSTLGKGSCFIIEFPQKKM